MKYILHIDTSGPQCILALAEKGILLGEKISAETNSHAALINVFIADLLTENQIGLKDIAALCVIGGPGSYTGLRIGLATAKGICYALDKPLILQNKLDVLCLQSLYRNDKHDFYMALLPAREKEYFYSMYNKEGICLTEPQHIMGDILLGNLKHHSNLLIIGEVEEVKPLKKGSETHFSDDVEIDLNYWATLTYEWFLKNKFAHLAHAEPSYLKQVFIQKSKDITIK